MVGFKYTINIGVKRLYNGIKFRTCQRYKQR